MTASVLAFLLLAAAEPAAPPTPAPTPGSDEWRFHAHLYYRADAFRGMVQQEICGGSALQGPFEALSARLERARAQISRKSNSRMFDRGVEMPPPSPQCSDEKAQSAMRGFEEKVIALEAAAKAGVP